MCVEQCLTRRYTNSEGQKVWFHCVSCFFWLVLEELSCCWRFWFLSFSGLQCNREPTKDRRVITSLDLALWQLFWSLITDVSPQMTDRADNMVTKQGRSDQISPMRLQLHCEHECLNLLSEECSFISFIGIIDVDMLGVSPSSPIDFNTNWPQREIQWCNDPSFCFRFLPVKQEVFLCLTVWWALSLVSLIYIKSD